MKFIYRIVLGGLTGVIAIAAIVLYGMLSSPSLEPYLALQATTGTPGPSRVNARFMGTTTILFDDGKTKIMSDGFFSRPSIWRLGNDHLRDPDAPHRS